MNEKKLKYESEVLAARVGIHAHNKYGIDIITIVTIANVIFQIIKFIYDWYKNRNTAAKEFKRLGPVVKFIIWRKVRSQIKSRKEAKYIYQSMCDLVYNLSEEEVNKLFQL